MPIVAPVSPETATDEQRRLGETLFQRTGGLYAGPTALYLHNPGFAQIFDSMRDFVSRGGLSIPPALRLVAVLATTRFWTAQYAWTVQSRIAREAGVGDDVIEAIRAGRRPAFASDDQEVVYDYVSALLERRKPGESLEARALALLGQAGLVELVSVVGMYSLVGLTCAAFDPPLRDGQAPPLG